LLKGLAHICFYTQQLENIFQFYTSVLGFEHSFDFVNTENERYGFMLHSGGTACLEFFNGDVEVDSKNAYKHFCIEVEDIEEYLIKLKGANVDCTEIKMGKDNTLNFWFNDIDENLIEVHQYNLNSKEIKHPKE